eukprot:TRINITY_DN21116_c0_g1::TRINITY_DN21116_c0_g1_i1::g.23325::m.23325 TRINITY_DN21116_c0_g1::TRINITY_DN21116_c0_g1_i1::g.23325  ORF type:complete len:191 (-),score=19.19,NPV_P10/PF05531.7/14,NPV_P10/PF05531.7/18,NPV_P10/PF05531.7/1.1e+04 TRINITY_DN21116_c0_g1_i1:203-721(-)
MAQRVFEFQLVPGIYVTDYRQNSNPEVLKCDLKDFKNAVFHLERSINEIREMDPEGQDPDLVSALKENEDAIQWRKQKIEDIKNRLRELNAGHYFDDEQTDILGQQEPQVRQDYTDSNGPLLGDDEMMMDDTASHQSTNQTTLDLHEHIPAQSAESDENMTTSLDENGGISL